MSDQVSATTVRTLTAEVRTLVVGSRQITTSVAKQLDIVPLADLKVFGRVKLPAGGRWVIGSDAVGVLAVASYQIPYPYERFTEVKRLRDSGKTRAETITLITGNVLQRYDRTRCEQEIIDWWALMDAGRWDDTEIALHAAADASPLIVLAGLR